MPLPSEYIIQIRYTRDPAGEEPNTPGLNTTYQEKRFAYSTDLEAVTAAAWYLLNGFWSNVDYMIPPSRIVHIKLRAGHVVEAEDKLDREELLQ